MPEPCGPLCNYPCTKDHRTQREKILSRLAPNSGVSESERAIAEKALARIDASGVKPKSTARMLDRDRIRQAPASRSHIRGVRVRYPDGRWIHMDEDEVDWETVDHLHLGYRLDGETKIRMGGMDGQQVRDEAREDREAAARRMGVDPEFIFYDEFTSSSSAGSARTIWEHFKVRNDKETP